MYFFLINLSTGTILQVIQRSNNLLDTSLLLSRDYYKNTEGLLGRWDGIANDITNSNGVAYQLDSLTPQQLHSVANTCKWDWCFY